MPVLPEFMPEGKPGEAAASFAQGRTEGESWMTMQQNRRIAADRAEQEKQMNAQQMQKNDLQLALERMAVPLKQAEVQANLVQAKTSYDGALRTQQLRSQAYALKAQADSDFDTLNLITDDKARAAASREWLSRYSQLANIAELKDEFAVKNHLATSNVMDSMKLNMLTGADYRSFQALTRDLSPEDQQKAKLVKLGLQGRASGAGKKAEKVTREDGSIAMMVFDPNTGSFHPAEDQAPTVATAQPGDGPESVAPVAPVAGPKTFVSQTTEEKARTAEAGKQQAEYEAKLRKEKPRRQSALRQAEVLSDRMTEDIDELIGKVRSSTAGPGGVILEKFPGTSARDFSSNLDTIKANIGFQTLQAMREASPTGGALGQVSDMENKLLQSSLGSLQVGQSPAQLIANLQKVKKRFVQNFGIVRSAFDNEFGGGSGDSADSNHPMGWDDSKEQRLMELKAKLGK